SKSISRSRFFCLELQRKENCLKLFSNLFVLTPFPDGPFCSLILFTLPFSCSVPSSNLQVFTELHSTFAKLLLLDSCSFSLLGASEFVRCFSCFLSTKFDFCSEFSSSLQSECFFPVSSELSSPPSCCLFSFRFLFLIFFSPSYPLLWICKSTSGVGSGLVTGVIDDCLIIFCGFQPTALLFLCASGISTVIFVKTTNIRESLEFYPSVL